jgi:hypothetical protein
VSDAARDAPRNATRDLPRNDLHQRAGAAA